MKKMKTKAGYLFINEIKIREDFAQSRVNPDKLKRKEIFFQRNGYFKDKIVVDENNMLVDGYTTYLLAKKYDQLVVIVEKIEKNTEQRNNLQNTNKNTEKRNKSK